MGPGPMAAGLPSGIARTGEDHDRISLALAGFSPDEITIIAEQNTLAVEGRKVDRGDHAYLYQGVSAPPFRRVFIIGPCLRSWPYLRGG